MRACETMLHTLLDGIRVLVVINRVPLTSFKPKRNAEILGILQEIQGARKSGLEVAEQ